jgi:hypothetical protein
MNKKVLVKSVLLLGALGLFLLSGCENDYPSSIYNAEEPLGVTPEISSLTPPNLALAGVTVVTIAGKNFSSAKENNIVYFNATPATILEASATRLVIKTPVIVRDSVGVRVAVKGAELFSNTVRYRTEAAVQDLAKLGPKDVPWGITADKDGMAYASMVTSEVGVGIKKIVPNGDITSYAPKGGETFFSALKMGPAGVLYCVRNLRAVFQVATPGQASTTFATATSGAIYDIDFDSNGNLWGVGNNEVIYRVSPAKQVKTFAFKANLRSVRVFNNYVYVAGNKDGAEKVFRFPITGNGEIGAVEEYINFTFKKADGKDAAVYAITFNSDGEMYVGTDAVESIVIYHTDKSTEPLHPGLLAGKTLLFSWGKGTSMYALREANTEKELPQMILRINTLKQSAPYYGLQ